MQRSGHIGWHGRGCRGSARRGCACCSPRADRSGRRGARAPSICARRGSMSGRRRARLKAFGAVDPEREWERLEKAGITVLTWTDDEYPERLRSIASAPAILYLRGTLIPDDALAVAIVGTRRDDRLRARSDLPDRDRPRVARHHRRQRAGARRGWRGPSGGARCRRADARRARPRLAYPLPGVASGARGAHRRGRRRTRHRVSARRARRTGELPRAQPHHQWACRSASSSSRRARRAAR